MATFTMNSQKNFVQAKGAGGIFDKAFAFSVVLIVIVGGIWATERLLIYLTDRQIANYQAETAAHLESVSAEEVEAVHDVTSRLAVLSAPNPGQIAAAEVLSALERSTIPQVRLTSYEYKSDGTALISGVTTDYRFIAEQILRYRQEALFGTAEVTASDRIENSEISFTIEARPAKPAASEVIVPAP